MLDEISYYTYLAAPEMLCSIHQLNLMKQDVCSHHVIRLGQVARVTGHVVLTWCT